MEVGAGGHAHRAVHLLFEAEAGREARGHSPGVDGDGGPDLERRRVLAATALSRHADDAAGAVLEGTRDGHAFVEASPGLDGALGEGVIEVHARAVMP